MRKCDHFRDLILTDYIDGQSDKLTIGSIESHLLSCSDCREYLKEVQNNLAMPFHQALHQPVPIELWDTIKQNIEQKNLVTSPWENIIDGLKGFFAFPRMVPVFASLILMLLVGSVTLNTVHFQQAQAKDQGEYLISLLSSTGPSVQGDSNDPGTPIEHYFL